MCTTPSKDSCRSSKEYKQVERVAKRIVASAKDHCSKQIVSLTRQIVELDALGAKVKRESPESRKREEFMEKLQMWNNALKSIKGDWHFIVTKRLEMNAFVSDLCPRRIFVHQGLLETLKPTDDELALILGHEISHLILGHCKSNLDTTLMYTFLMMVFLTLVDPSGFVTAVLEYAAFDLKVSEQSRLHSSTNGRTTCMFTVESDDLLKTCHFFLTTATCVLRS